MQRMALGAGLLAGKAQAATALREQQGEPS